MNYEQKPPIFVVSTGRSGSMMLAKVLGLHPEICSFHEPLPQLNTEAYAKWNGRITNERIEKNINRKRKNLIIQIQRNGYNYLESSHFCSHLIPLLVKLFNAKIIHIYRNGYDFVNSGLNRSWYNESGTLQKSLTIIRRLTLWNVGYQILDHRLNPPKKLNSKVEKISWLWSEINRIIIRDLNEIPSDQKLSIKLEEFDESLLKSLSKFINVEFTCDMVERMIYLSKTKPNKTNKKRVLMNEKEKENFQKIAAPMLKTLGY